MSKQLTGNNLANRLLAKKSMQIIAIGIVLTACRSIQNDPRFGYDNLESSEILNVPLKTTPQFAGACRKNPGDEKFVLGFVGDILMHGALQKQAYKLKDQGGFINIWRNVVPNLKKADIMYGNLEGPTAYGIGCNGKLVRDPGYKFSGNCKSGAKHPGVYTNIWQFNYHPSLVDSLVESGFDVVSTANNHSLDRGRLGIDRTIEKLNEAKMPFTGTRTQSQAESNNGDWHVTTMVEKNGVSLNVAWLACTYGMNGMRDRTKYGQVIKCFKNKKANSKVLSLLRDLDKEPSIDAVILTPHWGTENRQNSNGLQERTVKEFINAGALIVMGSHPHVLEPWQKIKTAKKEALVMYSLANFASNQMILSAKNAASMILYVGLVKGADGKVRIDGARYLPTRMTLKGGRLSKTLEPFDINSPEFVGANSKYKRRDRNAYKDIFSKFPTSYALRPNEEIVTNHYCK